VSVHAENQPTAQRVPLPWNLGYVARVVFVSSVRPKEAAMNLITKVIVWIVLSLFAAVGARAQDAAAQNVQSARMVICSSAEKAQSFAAQHQDVQAAIAKDETASGKDSNGASSACLVAGIAYVSGKQIDRVSSKDGSYHVTEIMIVGVATPYGMIAVEPSLVYTLLKVDEERA
jgi:hypothetical protein